MHEFTRNRLIFDLRDEGPETGEVVVLLHGFPETKAEWEAVMPGLTDAGYRVLAPDQRGYSPRARPRGRWAYRVSELVADVIALLDAAGVGRAHIVGHDWGGTVAWGVAIQHPERVQSLNVLSTPHPRALLRSMLTSTQAMHSWYMFMLQLPLLPDYGTIGPAGRFFRRSLVRSGLPTEKVDVYFDVLSEPKALRAAINWYRAIPFTPPTRFTPVTVPTLYVYSTGDRFLGRKAADLTERYISGPYRYVVLDDVSHWIPEEAPDEVTQLLLDHIGR